MSLPRHIFLLFLSLTTATFLPSHSTQTQSGSLECSLNGILDASTGRCSCDAPWKGIRCEELDFVPQSTGYTAAFGWHPNTTSWGGNMIYDERDGLYHLFVSVISDGCGLSKWTSLSYIAHAVAKDPMAQFEYKDTAIGVFAHNAAPIRAPPNHSPCPGCYYLFHIGTGKSGHKRRPNATCQYDGDRSDLLARKLESPGTVGNGLMGHRSMSPYGPWVPFTGPGCNNPAPAFDASGTLFVVCYTKDIFRAVGSAGGKMPLQWARVGEIPLAKWILPQDRPYLRYEDGYLYLDHRGNWHFLTHTYDFRDSVSEQTKDKQLPTVASHAFSRDLTNWFLSPSPPFLSKVDYEDGTTKKFATMERPHLVFDKNRRPMYLVSAVSPIWPCDVCVMRQSIIHSCVACKVTPRYDWTYTLVRKLNLPVHS